MIKLLPQCAADGSVKKEGWRAATPQCAADGSVKKEGWLAKNKAKKRKRPWSPFKGVEWNSVMKKWGVYIYKDGEMVHLGYFDDEKESALKYDKEATPLGKPLNFPPPKE